MQDPVREPELIEGFTAVPVGYGYKCLDCGEILPTDDPNLENHFLGHFLQKSVDQPKSNTIYMGRRPYQYTVVTNSGEIDAEGNTHCTWFESTDSIPFVLRRVDSPMRFVPEVYKPAGSVLPLEKVEVPLRLLGDILLNWKDSYISAENDRGQAYRMSFKFTKSKPRDLYEINWRIPTHPETEYVSLFLDLKDLNEIWQKCLDRDRPFIWYHIGRQNVVRPDFSQVIISHQDGRAYWICREDKTEQRILAPVFNFTYASQWKAFKT